MKFQTFFDCCIDNLDRYMPTHDPYEERDYSVSNKKASLEKPNIKTILPTTNHTSTLSSKPTNTINHSNNNTKIATVSKPVSNQTKTNPNSITPPSLVNKPTTITKPISNSTTGATKSINNNINSNMKPNAPTISSSNNLNKPRPLVQQSKQNSPAEIQSKQPTANKVFFFIYFFHHPSY